MKRLAILALACFVVAPAHALRRAESSMECASIGVMVAAARAMHKAGVEQKTARKVLLDFMDDTFEPRSRFESYVDAALRFAAGPALHEASASDFAVFVGNRCIKTGGDLDALFGVQL